MNEEQGQHDRIDTILQIISSLNIVSRYFSAEYLKFGWQTTKVAILIRTYRHGGSIKPKELSKRAFRSPGTITPLIKALEKDGFVHRVRDFNDGRSTLVVLTDKGRDYVQSMFSGIEEIGLKALEPLTEENIEVLRALLGELKQQVLEYTLTPPRPKQDGRDSLIKVIK